MKIGCFLLSFSKTLAFVPLVTHPYYQDLSHVSFNQTWAINTTIFYYNKTGIGQPLCIKVLQTSHAPTPFCIKRGYSAYISSYVTALLPVLQVILGQSTSYN